MNPTRLGLPQDRIFVNPHEVPAYSANPTQDVAGLTPLGAISARTRPSLDYGPTAISRTPYSNSTPTLQDSVALLSLQVLDRPMCDGLAHVPRSKHGTLNVNQEVAGSYPLSETMAGAGTRLVSGPTGIKSSSLSLNNCLDIRDFVVSLPLSQGLTERLRNTDSTWQG